MIYIRNTIIWIAKSEIYLGNAGLVHMAHVGHSLIGDPTYGGKRKLSAKAVNVVAVDAVRNFPRQALHAASLGFVHPVTGEKVHFSAPLPADMTELLEILRLPVT